MAIEHSTQWQKMHVAVRHGRFPAAALFIGPLHAHIADFTVQVIQLALCQQGERQSYCGHCSDCHMIQRLEHPDVQWIKPEKNGSAIKIDQIRALQQVAFLTPQRARKQVIVIESADKMNIAASNALLKILEEPSLHTHFILIAEQVGTVLPTILSRCQMMHFSLASDGQLDNLLQLGAFYPDHTERFTLTQQPEAFLDVLIALIEKKQHPCAVAAQWSQLELSNVLWFLYLIYAQVHYLYINTIPEDSRAYSQLMRLKSLLNPFIILAQIDKINNILRKLSHNININQLLAVEDLLFSLGSVDVSSK